MQTITWSMKGATIALGNCIFTRLKQDAISVSLLTMSEKSNAVTSNSSLSSHPSDKSSSVIAEGTEFPFIMEERAMLASVSLSDIECANDCHHFFSCHFSFSFLLPLPYNVILPYLQYPVNNFFQIY